MGTSELLRKPNKVVPLWTGFPPSGVGGVETTLHIVPLTQVCKRVPLDH